MQSRMMSTEEQYHTELQKCENQVTQSDSEEFLIVLKSGRSEKKNNYTRMKLIRWKGTVY